MRKNPDGLKPLLVLAVTIAGVFAGNLPLKYYLKSLMNRGDQALVMQVAGSGNLGSLQLPMGLEYFFLFFPFALALAGLILSFGYLLQRPVSQLIRKSGPVRWSRALKSALIWLILAFMADLIAYGISPQSYQLNFQWPLWLKTNFWVLIFVPLQTASEELFFRGFLMDRLAGWGLPEGYKHLRQPGYQALRGLILPALLFTLLHLPNPEMALYGYWEMLPQYLGMAFFLGWLSYKDKGLERAWGVHLANNWYGIVMVNMQGSSVPSESAFILTHYRPLLGTLVLFFSIAVFMAYYFLKEKRQPHQS